MQDYLTDSLIMASNLETGKLPSSQCLQVNITGFPEQLKAAQEHHDCSSLSQ